MKTKHAWLALVACFALPPLAAAEDARTWSLKVVIATVTDETQRLTTLAAVIADPTLRNADMCDFVADALSEVLTGKRDAPAMKATRGEYVRILANCVNAARYRGLLLRTSEFARAVAISNYVDNYMKRIRGSEAEQYPGRATGLREFREELIRGALDARPTQAQAEAIATLPASAKMDDFFAAAGKPAFVRPNYRTYSSPVVSVNVRQLVVFWRGIGYATFDYQREPGVWYFHEFVGDPMAFEGEMPYRAKAAELGLPDDNSIALAQLLTLTPAAMRAAAQSQYGSGKPSSEFMDTAAEVLIRNHARANSPDLIDAHGWICNVLADHGGGRYAALLAEVAESTADPKLKRYASQTSKSKSASVQPYIKGTVRLEEQKTKYPSLYPEVTPIRGLL
jgi:hypothetical protein